MNQNFSQLNQNVSEFSSNVSRVKEQLHELVVSQVKMLVDFDQSCNDDSLMIQEPVSIVH